MKLKGLTHSIIGAAIVVLKELKPGLDEKLYENALIIELRHRNHTAEQQKQFPVHYRGELIGKLIPDLIVDNQLSWIPRWCPASLKPIPLRCWDT